MSKKIYKALYHPEYVPNPNWLKKNLLFWDRIYRIVPVPMKKEFGNNYIRDVLGLDPKYVPTLPPNENDREIFNEHEKSIKKAFIRIKREQSFKDFDDIAGFGVHPEKALGWVFDYLIKKKLARPKDNRWSREHYSVHPDAGDLILGCLASKMARRRGFESLTGNDSIFYVTSANEINRNQLDRPDVSMEGSLGSIILDFLVPKKIANMSFQDIIKLRGDYSSLRNSFHSTVSKITKEFSLDRTIDKKQAEELLNDCMNEYIAEYKKFYSFKNRSLRFIKDWRAQSTGVSVGALGTYISGGTKVGIVLGTGAASIAFFNILFSGSRYSDYERSFQYIHALRKGIGALDCIRNMKPYLVKIRFI